MKICIFDTETTGLPKNYKIPAIKGAGNWPHIVSISWIIMDGLQIIKKANFTIYPESWDIPIEASNIHGITTEIAKSDGIPLSEVINIFRSEKYDVLVAHNMEFDYNVLMNAILWDLGLPCTGLGIQTFCTMRYMAPICKIPSKYGFKNPKLSEMYFYVMKKNPDNSQLHNSIYDAEILVEVIQNSPELQKRLGISNIEPQYVCQKNTILKL